jgi:NAD(P)-dependent dehydrogenase (short-subunit alcohol dehydrogenase family)
VVHRVALVTGANSGIGWAIAERLQADGYQLGFNSRNDRDETREAYETLAARGRAEWLVGDLTEEGIGERLVGETVERLGRLDVLVNNAGVTSAKPTLELTEEDFDHIISVDVKGAFLLSQAAARSMRSGGYGGSIVNVTSVHEHVPRPGFTLYAAAKAALGMISRSMALELGEHGIRVNSVAPGVIETERNTEDAEALAPEIPLGRVGTPQEVAALVSWLVGDESSYVTGASFVVDGGRLQRVFEQPAW